MIKIMMARAKTDSFKPEPWHWSEEPFPAFRGVGAHYRAFQAVANGYKPQLFEEKAAEGDSFWGYPPVITDRRTSRIITTRKGTQLLVPCSPEQDEKIMLLTFRGDLKGEYSRLEAVGADIIQEHQGFKSGCPTVHLVVRLVDPKGYVFGETGRRTGKGTIDFFSWDGYREMPIDEFEMWVELQKLDRGEIELEVL